jgi:hypothetical protein
VRIIFSASAPFGGFGGLEDQKEKILHSAPFAGPFAGPKGENLQNKNKKKIY